MSLPSRTTVVIVGAGPAGLTTALSLLHHGFRDFVIVDAQSQGQNSSRAFVIHPAALEALDTIGCGDEMISQGITSVSFSMGTRSTTLMTTRFESLRPYTRRPYALIIPQSVTERTLEKKLASFGVTIHRPLKVVGLSRHPGNPELSDITFEDGKVITTQYVIGADGVRSAVRSMAGIGFSDPTPEAEDYLAQVVLADVTFDTDDIATGFTMSPDGFFLCLSLPSSLNECLATDGQNPISKRIYRIGCGVPLKEGDIPHAPPKDYLQKLVNRFAPYTLSSDPTLNPNKPVCIQDIVWSSRFRNHAAIADRMFTRLDAGQPTQGGVVLLVGDAAHIHSPAGGQGMNLGLRDGIFLGEAVANHVRATRTVSLSDADAVLHTFAATRHARALEVIAFTRRLLAVEGMKYRQRMFWWLPVDSETVRAWMLWVAGSIPFVQRKMAWELSGLGRR